MVTTVFWRFKGLSLTLLVSGLLLCGCKAGDQASSTSADSAKSSEAVAAAPAMDGVIQEAPQNLPHASASGKAEIQQAAGASNGAVALRTASMPKSPAIEHVQRQVIRHAELDIRVSSVEKSEKEVASIVTAVGGYTEKATSTDLASAHPVLTLALRVPVGSFDATISKFETLGVRLSKTINSDDVTGQLVDMDARLKILRAQEDVYRDMLKNRTSLADVFNIQSQLRDVRTQIETIAGERQSQAGLAALSTINLTMEQNAVVTTVPADPNWFAMTLSEASSGAGSAFRTCTVAVVWAVAFSPFWIPVLVILRRLRKTTRSSEPF